MRITGVAVDYRLTQFSGRVRPASLSFRRYFRTRVLRQERFIAARMKRA